MARLPSFEELGFPTTVSNTREDQPDFRATREAAERITATASRVGQGTQALGHGIAQLGEGIASGLMLAEDARNGLTLAGYPGYEDLPIIDTSPRMAAIRDLSPAAADEIERELKKKHVLSIDAVAAAWPQVKDRLLKDRDMAHLGDLRASEILRDQQAAGRACRDRAMMLRLWRVP